MKKIAAVCIGMAVLTTFWGCGASASAKQTNGNPESGLSSESVSSTISGSTTEDSSQAAEASSSVTGGSSQISETKKAVNSVTLESKEPSYSIKTVTFQDKKNGNDLKAEYPQITGNAVQYVNVNTLLKNAALQTIHSLQYDRTVTGETVAVTYKVEYSSQNFISVVFVESDYYKNGAHPSSALCAVNYNLKTDTAVEAENLVARNNALYNAIESSAKKQLPKASLQYFTPEYVSENADCSNVYFKKDQFVMSFKVNHALGDHVELTFNYGETAGFRTQNAVWNIFTKN